MGSVRFRRPLVSDGPYVPPSGLYPNEPAGAVVILDRGFNSIDETDDAGVTWADGDGGPGTFEAFQTVAIESTHTGAPVSSPNVAAVKYPAGHGGSSSSASVRMTCGNFAPLNQHDQLIYLAFGVMIGEGYYGHEGGQNKIFYLGDTMIPEFGYESGRGGIGNDPYFNWTIATQGVPNQRNFRCTGVGNLASPTLAQAQILRGVWQFGELLVRLNTPGEEDGGFRFWVNGNELMHYEDIALIATPGSYDDVATLQFHPIYGGGNVNTVPSDQYLYLDHVYLSALY